MASRTRRFSVGGKAARSAVRYSDSRLSLTILVKLERVVEADRRCGSDGGQARVTPFATWNGWVGFLGRTTNNLGTSGVIWEG